MLTWWCRNSLKATSAYTWAVTCTLVLFCQVSGCQSRTLPLLCVFFFHQPVSWALPCASVTLGSWYRGISLLLGNSRVQITKAQRSPTPIYWPIMPLKLHPQNGFLSPFPILLGLYIPFWWGNPSADGIRHLHTLQRCTLSLPSLQCQ